MILLFLIQLLLEARAEICNKFRWFFGVSEDKKNLLRLTDLFADGQSLGLKVPKGLLKDKYIDKRNTRICQLPLREDFKLTQSL